MVKFKNHHLRGGLILSTHLNNALVAQRKSRNFLSSRSQVRLLSGVLCGEYRRDYNLNRGLRVRFPSSALAGVAQLAEQWSQNSPCTSCLRVTLMARRRYPPIPHRLICYGVDPKLWAKRYDLEPFSYPCYKCGKMTETTIPFVQGTMRGLVAPICNCGHPTPPYCMVRDSKYGDLFSMDTLY